MEEAEGANLPDIRNITQAVLVQGEVRDTEAISSSSSPVSSFASQGGEYIPANRLNITQEVLVQGEV